MADLQESKIKNSTITWQPIDTEQTTPKDIYSSWCNSNFLFKEENIENQIKGLRSPQIGGIFAALGYERSDSKSAATLVMPTGTGKTETILSIVVAGHFKKTLVIVPSDALREQTKNKFVQLGLLRELGLIGDTVENPVVATIKHGVDDLDDLDKLLKANVIVASASALSKFTDQFFYKLIDNCSHLIVDEAHHVTAATWARIKSSFDNKSVFQFTATPFRSDGSRVEGKIIFNYPLKKAQEDGYFKPIEFHPVKEFIEENADKAIADKAIALLRADLNAGLDHILMARANTITKAEEIFEIYALEKDLNPILINSKVKKKAEVLKDIIDRKHKVIVCVNMLGEGFDLPQLKISAIHVPHKSINIMLQFTGRFTRTIADVGDAKFIANIANPNVNESLEELYKEDSDWNSLVSDISSRKINDEQEYQEFRAKFSNSSKLLDLGLKPSISTTIYTMQHATWSPERYQLFATHQAQISDYILNDEKTMLVFSVKSYIPVGWTSSKELFDESWDLYIAYYDQVNDLLFIHSSAKDGMVKRLAKLIAKNSFQIKGEHVFRSLAGLKRLKLQNVGLNKNKKGLRYSMHTGTEINEQIPDIEANRAIKSNVFGKGYENGQLVSLGCSYKGKIWAMDSDSLDKWVAWCNQVGTKVLDDTIDTNQVMKTAMQTEELSEYPTVVPLTVEWPVELLRKNETKVTIYSIGWQENLIHCELLIAKEQDDDSKTFNIVLKSQYGEIIITATIVSHGEVNFSSNENVEIKFGEQSYQLTEFFTEHPPTLFLCDTSVIDGGFRYYPNEEYAYRYDKNNIECWDWTGIDISIESQTPEKITNSIQYHTIQKLKDNYDLVFDDDGAGEIADIVAIKNIDDKELVIDLFHCKYCSKKNGIASPGARVSDVYEVIGQAAKSIKWFGDKEKLIIRLMDRERKRLQQEKPSRIDKGHYENLVHLAKVARYSSFRLGVAIVQPAISKSVISDDQRSIIGATAAYIDEISGVKLRVITNN